MNPQNGTGTPILGSQTQFPWMTGPLQLKPQSAGARLTFAQELPSAVPVTASASTVPRIGPINRRRILPPQGGYENPGSNPCLLRQTAPPFKGSCRRAGAHAHHHALTTTPTAAAAPSPRLSHAGDPGSRDRADGPDPRSLAGCLRTQLGYGTAVRGESDGPRRSLRGPFHVHLSWPA